MRSHLIVLVGVGLSVATTVLAFIYSIPLMEAVSTAFDKLF